MRSCIGTKIRGETISMIPYAEDIVFITEAKEDIQRTMSEIKEMFEVFKMKIKKKDKDIGMC